MEVKRGKEAKKWVRAELTEGEKNWIKKKIWVERWVLSLVSPGLALFWVGCFRIWAFYTVFCFVLFMMSMVSYEVWVVGMLVLRVVVIIMLPEWAVYRSRGLVKKYLNEYRQQSRQQKD